MRDHTQTIAIVAAILAILGCCALAAVIANHESTQAADNNAFAKQCNDQGKVAHFGFEARQCLSVKTEGGR